jgi:hypothetical protein
MPKYTYGIASMVVDNINPADGTALGDLDLDIVDIIYRDTFDMTEEDGTTTDHYSEMDNTPFLSFEEPGKETLALQLTDTQVTMLETFLGGAVVSAGGKKTWSKPANQGVNEKHIVITTTDGTIITIPRAKVVGKKNFTFRRNQPWTLAITLTPLTPKFPALAAMDISEPDPLP